MQFIKELEHTFREHANIDNALPMEKYMKNNFTFYGIKTDLRRSILKKIWQDNKNEVAQKSREIAQQLFQKTQREYHYCAIEISIKELKKKYIKKDYFFIKHLIITNSWWDTVDSIAKNILGTYLQQYPEEIENSIENFSNSNNIWLNRSGILFQLGYNKQTNPDYLFSECIKHAHSKEFFIQKAIGWALREYAKVNPEAVLHFVEKTNLKPLSKREALKHLLPKI